MQAPLHRCISVSVGAGPVRTASIVERQYNLAPMSSEQLFGTGAEYRT